MPSGPGERDKTPLAEWLMAALGLVLLLGSISFLVYQGLSGDDAPPDIAIEVESFHETQGGYLVQVRVVNEGEGSAAGVTLEATLANGDVETSEITFDYVPARSERKGGLFFTNNPQEHALELRVKGYREP